MQVAVLACVGGQHLDLTDLNSHVSQNIGTNCKQTKQQNNQKEGTNLSETEVELLLKCFTV